MNIKFVIFDFDGVFTDGKCYFNDKTINKFYNIKDGMALKLLRDLKIKTGLISSYSSNKNLLLNNFDIDKEIASHLKFDYKFIGEGSKIEILDNWLQEMNITYDNIAYIGDDINDIDIIKVAKFSACPNDAIDECKKHVDFICERGGGEGCVREFVEKIVHKDKIKNNKILEEINTEFKFQINNFDILKIVELSEMLETTTGNILLCGVGKSGNIAKHCCDLLKCVSLKAYYLDIINQVHGDIGALTDSDILLMFSNSGNTNELVNLIPNFKKKGIKIVGICSNSNSKFFNLCDLNIVTPFKNEISGNIDKIPTNSFMSHLIFTIVLISLLKSRICITTYKENHSSGNISKELLTIKDVLIQEFPKIIINDEITHNGIELTNVLLVMTSLKIGCCFFITNDNKLIGILTDGDIRRFLLKNDSKNITVNDINKNYYYESDLDKYLKYCKNVAFIPIINNKNNIIGIIKN